MTIKAILFDKDGTLLDFDATFAPATAAVLQTLSGGDQARAQRLAEAVDFDLASQTIQPGSVLVAGSLENIAETLLPEMDETQLAEALARVDALYVEHSLNSLTAFEFTQGALDQLAAMGLQLGVATNDSEEAAIAHLQQMGLMHRFGFIAGFDSGHGEKPAPGMVTAFIQHLGLAPDEVIMVGDSPHDCKAGRAAGAVTVGVTCGGATAEQLAPYADHIVDDIRHLADLLHRLAASDGDGGSGGGGGGGKS